MDGEFKGWLGSTMEELIGKDEFLIRKEYYDKALHGEHITFESEWEGEYFFNSVSPLVSYNDQVNQIVIASQLITNLKKAQIELDKNQYLLRKIIDTAPIFISQIDKDGYYITANLQLSNLFGVPNEEIVGKHFTEIISENMRETFGKNLELAKENGKFDDIIQMDANGKLIYNNYIISATKDNDGNHSGYVVIGIDITDLKDKEFDLIEKNQLLFDSHTYAKRIQQGILGNTDEITGLFKESFIYFNPKEELSGDFFWCGTRDNKKILIAGDCTGHGVSGALLTIIGINFLNEIIRASSEITKSLKCR